MGMAQAVGNPRPLAHVVGKVVYIAPKRGATVVGAAGFEPATSSV
jgi:hypothetical protein